MRQGKGRFCSEIKDSSQYHKDKHKKKHSESMTVSLIKKPGTASLKTSDQCPAVYCPSCNPWREGYAWDYFYRCPTGYKCGRCEYTVEF